MTRPLRLLICTKRDLAGCLILNHVLPRLDGCAVRVLLSDKTRPVECEVPELATIKALERDVPLNRLFPVLDAAEVDGAPVRTFAALSRHHRVAIETIDDINGPAGEDLVRGFAPDLILSARFSLIFKPNIFEIPPLGAFNLHPGALPRFAGLFAPFRCLMEGETAMGCTLHRIDRGIDTGPVLGIGWLPVDRDRSLVWHVIHAYGPGLDLFLDMLDRLRRGEDAGALTVQDVGCRRYGTLPGPDGFAAFRSRGLKLFDPDEYLALLRGFLPPGRVLPAGVTEAVTRLARRDAVQARGGGECCCAPG